MFSTALLQKTKTLFHGCQDTGIKIATAESCTGGLVAGLLTELPGSSEIFERGFVTYSNAAKIDLLTVPTFFIEEYGAVSRETAIAMAEGALLLSRADMSVAVTGIAGPDGGTADKPVGTVHFATAYRNKSTHHRQMLFDGNREAIRLQSVEIAIDMLLERLKER